jgi:hypothetical protein
MRTLIAVGLAGAALAGLAACNKPASAPGGVTTAPSAAPAAPASGPLSIQDLPHRKPGLWRQTLAIEGMDQQMPATEVCLDQASEAKMSMLGQRMNKDKCASQSFSRNLDGSISFNVSCEMGPNIKTVSNGTISGDFNANYTAVINTTTAGGAGERMSGVHKMTITATWIGPCAPGQKGGDVIMPDGRKINLTDAPTGAR